MKKSLIYFMTLLFAGLFVMSCDDDDDDPVVIDNPIYGMQITGSSTDDAVLVIEAKQVVEPSSDYATKAEREGMYYGIHFLKAGDFSFSEVTADATITYGATVDSVATQSAEAGEEFSYSVGKLAEGGTGAFTVVEEGLYYIMTDETSSKFWVMKINSFEISATGDKIAYTAGASGTATFEADAVDIRANFKLRINTAWKFICEDVPYGGDFPDDHIRPVISYGGTLASLSADGDDISVDNNGQLLDFTLTWTSGSKGIAGFSGSTAEAGELPPAEYPDEIYIVGEATEYGWDEPGTHDDALFHKVAGDGNTGLYWKICYLRGTKGFKIAGAAWGNPNLGYGEVDEFDASGVTVNDSSNMSVADSAMYMVVLDMRDEENKVSVIVPEVYGIGDAFGSGDYTEDEAATLFTIDNVAKTLTSAAATADGNMRMYTNHSWIASWWNAEFVLNTTSLDIEYRNDGGDPAAYALTSGQTVTFSFDANTGTVQ